MSDNYLLNLIENKKKAKKLETHTSEFSLTDFTNILNNCNLKYDLDFNEDVNNLFAATANLFYFIKQNILIESMNQNGPH